LRPTYAFEYERLGNFFAGNPADASAWRGAIERAQRHPRDRARLTEISSPSSSGAARRRGGRCRRAARDARAVAIVTGQQAGLFGGPLFTLLKALTTIRLADKVSAEHGVPVVPVFWIDAEDHDWDEVRSCGVFDADLNPVQITVGHPPGRASSRSRASSSIQIPSNDRRSPGWSPRCPPGDFTHRDDGQHTLRRV
jgi:uncharacterized protein YllA (UPF0747 family)